MEYLRQLFSPGGFQPHGYCYQWNSGLVWLNVVSDACIAISYFTIPCTLLWFIRKRRDLPFSWMFGLFGVFIVACGTTHVMEVWNLWHAQYWLAGVVKAVTATASVATAILLARLMPRALELPNVGKWIQANAALEAEIEERRGTEVELRIDGARQSEIAGFLNLTHDAIFVRNLKDEIVFWNKAAEELYGWLEEEARGKTPSQLLKTVFPIPRAEIEATIVETGYWEGELIHHDRGGATLTVSSRWAARREGGKQVAILESNRDITQRRQTEEALRQTDEKLRALVLGVQDYAILMLDTNGLVTTWNDGAERIKGYRAEEIIGQHFSKFYAPEAVALGEPALELKIAEEQGRFEEEGWRIRKDGSGFWANVVITPLWDNTGKLRGFGKVTRDITERKHAAEILEGRRKELAQSNARLVGANEELESFSYSVSHDLRSPLRAIDGFSHALLEDYADRFDEAGRNYLERIRAATQRMGALIDDLLSLSRISRAEMHKQNLDVSALARSVMSELQNMHPERRVGVSIEDGLRIMADGGLVRVALENLLNNAWKFTSKRECAHIEFGMDRRDGARAYFVRDDGAGFDPAYASRLFGAFQRLHTTSEFPGTGIGLATVQRIVTRHGGRIWAESAVDRGATFYFTLSGTVSQERL
jgi:PAS domain S-box-containing protein